MNKHTLPAEVAVEYLNKLFTICPEAMENLARARVVVHNKGEVEKLLAEPGRMVVHKDEKWNELVFGVVGLLNGLITEGRVAAVFEGDEPQSARNRTAFLGFKVVPESHDSEQVGEA